MRFVPRFDVRLVRDGRVATLEPTIIRRPEDTLPVLEAELSELGYEKFIALALNTKNHVTAVLPVSSGSLNASIVHPRELFQRAILANCASLILAHNHPSGDPAPSPEDIALTRKLIDAGLLLDIPILDHVILGYGKYASFKEMRLL
jgi:DNA repair protein RadC